MKIIWLTQGQFTIVDDEDYLYLSQWNWQALTNKSGIYYAKRGIGRKGKSWDIKMHRLIMDVTNPKIFVDHRDGNGLNNQRYNLRIATSRQNCANRRKPKDKFLGVYQQGNRWRARIRNYGIMENLGCFGSDIEAAIAYDLAAIRVHGEFARLNNVSSTT